MREVWEVAVKYTIELTSKQKNQMDFLMELAHRYIGFNPRFEDVEATNIDDTPAYQMGYQTGYDIAQCNAQATKEEWGKAEYNRGYEDGKNEAIYNGELIPELKAQEYDKGFEDGYNKCLKAGADEDYNKGYDKALEDASDLITYIDGTFIQECFPVEYNNGLKFYDLNALYSLAYILKKWKQYLEKQEIKIGDEVSNEDVTKTIIVTNIHDDGGHFDGIDFNGTVYKNCSSELWNKTGRHFEIIDLLNQLKRDKGKLDEESNQDTTDKFQDRSEQLQADIADGATSSNEEDGQANAEIKVGDIVEYYEGGPRFVVTIIHEDGLYGIDFEGDIYDEKDPNKWEKIGHSDELMQVLSKLQADYWKAK